MSGGMCYFLSFSVYVWNEIYLRSVGALQMPVVIDEVTKKRHWKKPQGNLKDLSMEAKTSKQKFFAYHFNQEMVEAYARTFMVKDYKSKAIKKKIRDEEMYKKQELFSENKKRGFNNLVEKRYQECIQKQDIQAAIRAPLHVACNIMATHIFHKINKYGPDAFWKNFDMSDSFKSTFRAYYASFLKNGQKFDSDEIKKNVNEFNDVEYDVWNICLHMWHYRRRVFHLHWCSPDFKPQPHGKCCLLYTSPSPRDGLLSRMPSSA